jgi:hypothetical protein
MPLPGAACATLDLRKLADYCLSPVHPRGRHGARVFRDALGIEQANAAWLRGVLLDGIVDAEAVEAGRGSYGTTWRVDIRLAAPGERASAQGTVVRSLWLAPSGSGPPRFVTCWVK